MDIIIRNARLLDGQLLDVGIEDGVIAALAPSLAATAKEEYDLEQHLLMPAFVNGQLHACKVFWRRKLAHLPADVRALTRFDAAKHVKASYTPEDVASRVSEVVRLAIANGTCAMRLFADVDEAAGLTALKGLLAVKRDFAHILPLQVVAFPQDGVGGRTEKLMLDALEMGADVVGGIPWIETSQADKQAHAEMCFSLAKKFDKDVHIVADDTTDPASRTLEQLAELTISHNYQQRVAATQCAALAFYDDAYAKTVINKVKQAGITVFSNAHVSLVTTEPSSNPNSQPYPRGITRIHELQAAKVPVACAQDDIDNWYYPFGRNDMLEVAQFMAHAGNFAWDALPQVIPMVSSIPAQVLGIEHGLAVGKPANLVGLAATDWHEAIQFQPEKTLVILAGRRRAQQARQQQLWLD
jgi:cytosine deaminase